MSTTDTTQLLATSCLEPGDNLAELQNKVDKLSLQLAQSYRVNRKIADSLGRIRALRNQENTTEITGTASLVERVRIEAFHDNQGQRLFCNVEAIVVDDVFATYESVWATGLRLITLCQGLHGEWKELATFDQSRLPGILEAIKQQIKETP